MKVLLASLLTLTVLLPWETNVASPADVANSRATPLQVFLVRHAEKVDASSDPALSEAGLQRAQALAHTLRDAAIEHIHSSDYIRTRDTAAPLAELLGQEVSLYDVEALPDLAEALRTAGGRHLVVGHSDTTPELVTLLGGEPGPEINEASEYDRLYLLAIDTAGNVTTTLLRYGEGPP
ncbi:histidine phosphatase family protein [Parahaliea maris]|uniref:Histidine phosphatase family protein n=1 Tax=Parahaliea maris TaxID=2716870 RepID=A0A5C8ZWQ2_9GAMM|nr:phosphoglycerate mutase family protein [Parahaliea maris]TXS92896.1 histidine phosphatase family protein [Parahaliea maris]